MEQPRLIGLDWGTSALRAYLLGDGGIVLARAAQPWGVMSQFGGDFAAAFAAVVQDWDRMYPGLPAIAAGMVGSSEGWVRTPYRTCPAGAAELAAALVPVPVARAGALYVIPGVEQRAPAPNVMRGEETQIAGALALDPDRFSGAATLVLPGTHSKWVEVDAGRIARFDTYITGELYALLASQSILGRPAVKAIAQSGPAPGALDGTAFDRGVRTACNGGARGIMPLLFLTRSLVLDGSLDVAASLDYLSGLLIGEEVRSAMLTGAAECTLVGDPLLCARYARALAAYGCPNVPIFDNSAPAGLWRIAALAGVIAAPVNYA